jgi:hypothetical protein
MSRYRLPLGVVVLLALAAPVLAGGRKEREKKAELEPQIAKELEEQKKICGCTLPMEVKWDTYADASEMANIVPGCASQFTVSFRHQCKTPENKKAFCEGIKSLKVQMVSTGWLNKDTGKTANQRDVFKRDGNVLFCATDNTSLMPGAQLFDQEVFDKL